MALNIRILYPDGTVDDAAYPTGKPRDVLALGDGLGFPTEAEWVSDYMGFIQAIILEGGIVITGDADTADASQHLDGLKQILLQRSELASNGGSILQIDNRLPRMHMDGLHTVRDSNSLVTTNEGSGRNFDNTADIVVTSPIQKGIEAAWAPGNGGGGMPVSLTATSATWYRNFIVSTPSGVVERCWDTSQTASNFFADPAAAAAGFTDPSLYRRFRWDYYVDGSDGIKPFFNSSANPRETVWDVVEHRNLGLTITANRAAVSLATMAPPNALLQGYYQWIPFTPLDIVLITESDQADTVPTLSDYTGKVNGATGAGVESSGALTMRVDGSSQLFMRSTVTNGLVLANVTGWTDEAIAP